MTTSTSFTDDNNLNINLNNEFTLMDKYICNDTSDVGFKAMALWQWLKAMVFGLLASLLDLI